MRPTGSRLPAIGATLAAVLAFSASGCGQHGLSSPEQLSLAGPVTVPLEPVAGRLVISARVNGRGPSKFILDSGAEASLVAETFARDAGLPARGTMAVGSPGSRTPMTATLTPIDRLEIGGLTAGHFTALAMDLAALQQKVPGLAGVISVQLFAGLLVSYDYPAGVVRFRRGALPAADGRTIFDWPRGQGKPSVLMDVAGRPVRVDLDTGSQGTFTLSQEHAAGLAWLEGPAAGDPVKLVDATYAAWRGRLKGTIRFGQYTFENPALTIHAGPFNNVGYPVLKDFVFTVDPANRRFELTKP